MKYAGGSLGLSVKKRKKLRFGRKEYDFFERRGLDGVDRITDGEFVSIVAICY